MRAELVHKVCAPEISTQRKQWFARCQSNEAVSNVQLPSHISEHQITVHFAQ